jgi:hypothetical protein
MSAIWEDERIVSLDMRWPVVCGIIDRRLSADDPRRRLLRESKSEPSYAKLKGVLAELDAADSVGAGAAIRAVSGRLYDLKTRYNAAVLNLRRDQSKARSLSNHWTHKLLGDMPASLFKEFSTVRVVLGQEFPSVEAAETAVHEMTAVTLEVEGLLARLRDVLYFEQQDSGAQAMALLQVLDRTQRDGIGCLLAAVKRLNAEIIELRKANKAVGYKNGKRAVRR